MVISDGRTVAIEYTLTFGGEEVIDSNTGMTPLEFKQGKHQILRGIEKELEGMAPGDSKKIVLGPEDAYGPSIPEAVTSVPLAQLPEVVRKEGAMVEGESSDGQTMTGQVKKIDGQKVHIDFNHPLAGRTLHFDIKILRVK